MSAFKRLKNPICQFVLVLTMGRGEEAIALYQDIINVYKIATMKVAA
jgi:hypothetical protein